MACKVDKIRIMAGSGFNKPSYAVAIVVVGALVLSMAISALSDDTRCCICCGHSRYYGQ